jgi:hypothetical protein
VTDWSEQDKQALLALVTRFTRMFDARQRDQALRAEIDKRIAEYSTDILKLAGAMSIFGIDLKVAGWSKPIRAAVGDRAYDAALLAGGRVLNNDADKPSQKALPLEEVSSGDSTVREMTLEQLRAAGESGTTASAIRKHIETVRSTQLHYKTIGMTLYRLAQDGLARRDGRTWFAVPETANPGAAAPGSESGKN